MWKEQGARVLAAMADSIEEVRGKRTLVGALCVPSSTLRVVVNVADDACRKQVLRRAETRRRRIDGPHLLFVCADGIAAGGEKSQGPTRRRLPASPRLVFPPSPLALVG